MGSFQIKTSAKKIGFILASLLAPLVFAGQSYAALPYFKAYGGDVTTGGGFNSGQSSTACFTDFQPPNSTNPNKGGIMAFVKNSFNPAVPDPNNAGASSARGAFAFGVISNGSSSNGNYGFFAGGDGGNKLSFANSISGSIANYAGGAFEAANLTPSQHLYAHCIPDYFTTKQNSPTTYNGNVSTYGGLNGQYIFNNAGTTIMNSVPVSIGAGQKITFFVNGDAYIGGNITYTSGYNETNVPKFALVVKGNIYIAPAAFRLDGFYIAQPKTGVADSGNIWTCHDNSATAPTGDWLNNNCKVNSLTVSGGMVAKQIQLVRVKGDVATATPNESAAVTGAAEIFNYTPEMVVGGGFFNQTNTFGKIQSLVNLPPVF